jgi:CubicO group peptidase (beta-lactamase class C family)
MRAIVTALAACLILFAFTAMDWYDECPILRDSSDGTGPWKTGTPASQKIDATKLANGVKKLAADKSLRSILVIRNGVLVHESYYGGADARTSCNVHSASKSVLSTLAFCLCADGILDSIDTPIAEIMPEHFAKYKASDLRRTITVDDLMTMRSGIRWEDDETEYTFDGKTKWVQRILDLGLKSTPGTRFNYSTADAHLCSAVIEHLTGLTTAQYAQTRLYSRLGTEPERWLSDPEGVSMGGCCQYLTARELASYGLLFSNQGKNLAGKQVIPLEVVAASFTSSGGSYCRFWWTEKVARKTVYKAWGYGGQMVYVVPELKLVFVCTTTTTTNYDGREPAYQTFVKSYLIPACK